MQEERKNARGQGTKKPAGGGRWCRHATRRDAMFHSVLSFAMELSLLYLMTVTFIILDVLLLSIRARRVREERKERDQRSAQREARRELEAAEERQAFERRQSYLKPAQ
jgi:hypothetical protein